MPSLNALRAFDAAARVLSFSKAAEELNVTPAALSHQIRGLEAVLEVKLFHRRTRQVELSDAGRLIQPEISEGFDSLRRALGRLNQRRSEDVIVISAGPAFTAKWLAPRLNRFAQAHPKIDLRIAANLALTDFAADGVDAAIRFGQGTYPGCYRELLLEEAVTPMCSPALIGGPEGLRAPGDLARFTLIHDESLSAVSHDAPAWQDWLAAAGVEAIDLDRGLRFNLADHAIDAAVEGAGVLLARRVLAQRDLQSGRLVAPFDLELDVRQAFYFVCPEGHEQRPVVKRFRAWLMAETEAG